MNSRIQKLAEMTLNNEFHPVANPTGYDREDLFLDPVIMSGKRVKEYILNQKPIITEYNMFAGGLQFDDSVEGDFFQRFGHKNEAILLDLFYNKPLNNLVTLEWQHSTADFGELVKHGIRSILERIDASLKCHTEEKEINFLLAEKSAAEGIIGWAHKNADAAKALAETVSDPEHKQNLLRLSEALYRVPENPAESFYEGVASIYCCFAFQPDSIGTIDRHLVDLYRKDKAAGVLTDAQAKEYLQELYLLLQARSDNKDYRFTRGGQSHFCVGGYLSDGSDGFTEFSRLVLDALLELPTHIPQISLRWTEKTKFEDFRYVLQRAVADPQMRIAFVNDEPRIKGLMNIVGLSYEDAIKYTMVGCNEPALPGGMIMGACQSNVAHFLMDVFYTRREDLLKCETFEQFYALAEEELGKSLLRIIDYDNKFNMLRARDTNLVSSLFFRGCIENAKSMTQGGCTFATAMLDLIGTTTVIDSVSIVKQFVYDEKKCSLAELCAALDADWQGYEDLHTLITNKGLYFGNDDDTSNEVARMVNASIHNAVKDELDFGGRHYIIGDLIGYNEHNKWFGEEMKATPDGRHAGERISFGRGQADNRDRNGLTALLSAVASCDPTNIVCGPTVTNIMLDPPIVKVKENFEKLVIALLTYFKQGGIHFQLSYTDRETLISARQTPDKYKTLRVRVSGFSDYFNNLNTNLQDEIIDRTSHDV